MSGGRLVSIIVPCYNQQDFIGQTLSSVLRQTWRDIEVIVVNDGSTDQSVDVVQRTADHRVRLIEQAKIGACAARNRGLALATGEFVQFLDADDIIDPDNIRLQISRLVERPRAVASSQWGRFVGDAADAIFRPHPTWADLSPLDWTAAAWADGLPMHCPAIWLVPRQICDEAGPWDETLVQNTDGEYFTRVLLAAEYILHCPGARVRYRSGLPHSVSRQVGPDYRRSRFRALELIQGNILAHENSERMRLGLAIAWQHLAHFSYPYDARQAELALDRARALHPVEIQPRSGPFFNIINELIGWRYARKLQTMFGRV